VSNSFVQELHRSKYRLLGLVGQGQFGRVYCASHRKTGRLVALKELDRDRFSTHKFLRELRFLLSLQHENIVTCQAMEQTSTGRYLVMDYCEGGTLRNLLEEDVRLHPIQGLNLLAQILAGLEHAHQREIVHCDIKPENILLTTTAQGWTAKISDFGIARLRQELASNEFSNTGSPAYMAPERFYGQYSIASDLYAVGVLLFELVVGQRPFSGAPAELMSAHLNQTVQIPDSVPADVQGIIRKALQKLPARRFRSASEMLQTLSSAIANAEKDLSPEWATVLLKSHPAIVPAKVQYEYQEILDTPIQQLSHLPDSLTSTSPSFHSDQVFRVYGNRVGCQTYSEVVENSPALMHRQPPVTMTRVRLPDVISNLVVQSQGCFAVTPQKVYWLTATLFNPSPNLTPAHRDAIVLPQLVAEFDRQMLVAIAPNGTWMATAAQNAKTSTGQISIWKLHNRQPFKPAMTQTTPAGFQLLAPDAHHITLFSHLTNPDAQTITGVQIDFWTRRGTGAGCLKLAVPMRDVSLTLTPYRFLATEPNHPTCLLFLDVKPLRIRRVGLVIVPHLVAATIWGYAVISHAGEIVLLDQYGQQVGQIAGPPAPTALTFLAPHQLVIATWEDTHGYLYVVNLRDLDLDLLF